MNELITSLLLVGNLVLPTPAQTNFVYPLPDNVIQYQISQKKLLAKEIMDLNKRNPDSSVNDIFRDNILLNLHYIKGDQQSVFKANKVELYGENKIDWVKLREPFEFRIMLKQGELFSFHDELLPEFEKYKGNAKTGWTKFSANEGYKTLDGLSGNGVCHLASLINWTASEAGMGVTAKVNHDFYPVPGVDRKYGTSIVYRPGQMTTKMQNLYVMNNFLETAIFSFKADKDKVELEISEKSNP